MSSNRLQTISRREPTLSQIPEFEPPPFCRLAFATELADEHPWPGELESLGDGAREVRRSSFRLGRQAAHQALADLGRDVDSIPIGARREPVWPLGVVGSITHTDGIGLAVASHRISAAGLGIDLERRRPVPELSTQVPHGEEQDWIESKDDKSKQQALLDLFAAKEAIYKAVSPLIGRYFGFEDAQLKPTPGGFEARLTGAVAEAVGGESGADVSIAHSDGHVLAFVALEPDWPHQ